jgi:hypothetical protein
MRQKKQKLTLIAMLTVFAGRTADCQNTADQLKQLVEISARRLAIAVNTR